MTGTLASNLGEERIHYSFEFQATEHHCGRSRQEIEGRLANLYSIASNTEICFMAK